MQAREYRMQVLLEFCNLEMESSQLERLNHLIVNVKHLKRWIYPHLERKAEYLKAKIREITKELNHKKEAKYI